MIDRTRCDGCFFSTSMIINGRCIRCFEINADSDNRGNCKCRPGGWYGVIERCCDSIAGVYSESGTCKSCSRELAGCDKCDSPINGLLRCTRCLSGYNRVLVRGASICSPIGFNVYARPPTPNHPNNNDNKNIVIIVISEATHLVFTGFLISMLLVF